MNAEESNLLTVAVQDIQTAMDRIEECVDGLSHDTFAAAALQAILLREGLDKFSQATVCSMALDYAIAMRREIDRRYGAREPR